MKKIIYLLIAMSIFTQCVTQKKCFDKFPPEVGIKDTVIWRDTVYYFQTTTDTAYIVGGLYDTLDASSGWSFGQAWVTADTVDMGTVEEAGRVFIGEKSRWIQIRFHSTSAPWTLYWPVALRGVPLGYL